MQNYTKLEVAVGAFMVAGALALAYLSVSLGGLRLFGDDRYQVFARFSSVGGLKQGDSVRISGVSVGEVSAIRLVNFSAEAELAIDRGVEIPTDSIASVQSNGLLGDAYVSLSPGADDRNLAAGDKIARTEPAVSFTELIAKYAFGSPIDESTDTAPSRDDGSTPTSGGGVPAEGGGSASSAASTKPSPFSDPLEE
jgi:phospholipid/cholesterol/gamma-HCH transport system substrate-binding protein